MAPENPAIYDGAIAETTMKDFIVL